MTDPPPTGGDEVRIAKVLACVGASPWLESQVQTVTRLAAALHAQATFLHVGVGGSDPGAVHRRIEAALQDHGATAEISTVSGVRPDKAILRQATRGGFDLVYAGAAPHEPVLMDIMGSTARRIARGARCSVLLDTSPSGRAGVFRLAVVAVGMDRASRAIAGLALGLAAAGVIRAVHIVHEIEPVPHSALRGDAAGAWRLTRATADAELREFVSSLADPDAPARSLCVEGRDLSGVVAYSEQVGADLVVCAGPKRRIRALGRLVGHQLEALLTDLPSALMLVQAGKGRG